MDIIIAILVGGAIGALCTKAPIHKARTYVAIINFVSKILRF